MKVPQPNLLERALAVVAPKRAASAFLGRVNGGVMFPGQYSGARQDRTALKAWRPFAGSADSDTIGDLATLRSRSRDLERNAGIPRGAARTSKVNVVGSGLKLKAEVKRELLGLSEDEAEAWEANTETLFDLWASSKFADSTRAQNFYELQGMAFSGAWSSGDVFALRRFKEGESFVGLCLQMIEADRVCTPIDKTSDPNYRDGIETDGDGEAIAYHVLNRHPGDLFIQAASLTAADWTRIPAAGSATQSSLMVHLFDRERPNQARGVPMLAPVIEDLKQLDRYSEAELMAAVVSAFFTVFIKNDGGGSSDLVGEAVPGHEHYGPAEPSGQIALGSGSIVELGNGESIETANPNRPNANFDPFFLAVVRKIGIALGIPYEVLIMHFSSSYSASRAALEVAWQFFMDRRTWLDRNFCQPVYEWFLFECVARGIIKAPGFFEDPIRRAAWCGSCWIGPARIVIDPAKEASSEEAWVNMGVKTLEEVTIHQTGGNWKRNQAQRGRERAMRVGLDLEDPTPPATESSTGRPLQSGGGAKPSGGGSKGNSKGNSKASLGADLEISE